MSDLVQPAGFLEVVAHVHLEDEDGNAVEQDEPDEDEEGRLETHQRVVGEVLFAVHQVHHLSAPVGSGALNVLQKFLFQLDFLGLPMAINNNYPEHLFFVGKWEG